MAGASRTDNTVNETKSALITQNDARLQIPLILYPSQKMSNGLELCSAKQCFTLVLFIGIQIIEIKAR